MPPSPALWVLGERAVTDDLLVLSSFQAVRSKHAALLAGLQAEALEDRGQKDSSRWREAARKAVGAQREAVFFEAVESVRRAELARRQAWKPGGAKLAAAEKVLVAAKLGAAKASWTLLLPTLDAYNLGALLALYEHRTFVESVLSGINAFDQWGVELGKSLAKPIVAALSGKGSLPDTADPSTRALVEHVRALARKPA